MLYRKPDWSAKKALWFAWPSAKKLWEDQLIPAQQEIINLLNLLPDEKRVIICNHDHEVNFLRKIKLSGYYEVKKITYGDIWLRDTFGIMLYNKNKKYSLLNRFNGWGNKYLFEHDKDLRIRVAPNIAENIIHSDLCFEGGSVEVNGAGVLLTTTNCLLNSNRNPNWSRLEIEHELKKLFGVHTVVWLTGCLKNDHTDGHIDTLARFIAPDILVCMKAQSSRDPNFEILNNIHDQLSFWAAKLNLKLITVPSAGLIKNNTGEILPASYVNFIITHNKIILPEYNSDYDSQAQEILQKYTNKLVLSSSASSLIYGGGAFHCICQEEFGD